MPTPTSAVSAATRASMATRWRRLRAASVSAPTGARSASRRQPEHLARRGAAHDALVEHAHAGAPGDLVGDLGPRESGIDARFVDRAERHRRAVLREQLDATQHHRRHGSPVDLAAVSTAAMRS